MPLFLYQLGKSPGVSLCPRGLLWIGFKTDGNEYGLEQAGCCARVCSVERDISVWICLESQVLEYSVESEYCNTNFRMLRQEYVRVDVLPLYIMVLLSMEEHWTSCYRAVAQGFHSFV